MPLSFSSYLNTAVGADKQCENMRSALGRGLPEVRMCKPHDLVLSVASGGPSLEETYKDMTGYVGAVNGSLRFLLERDVVPNACAVCDPSDHMADIVEADDRVNYFIASVCSPRLFDKLKGCHVVLWHPSGAAQCEETLKEYRRDWFQIGGGCTVGLRWINLGYVCGFRKFELHGMDSSFRGGKTHAYPDRRDDCNPIVIEGYPTRMNFLAQVTDFGAMLVRLSRPDVDPIEINVHGEGLLQHMWRKYQAVKDKKSASEAFAC